MKTYNKKPLFAGLAASVIILLIKLLKTERFSHIPVYFIFGIIILLPILLLIFYFNFHKRNWLKYSLSIALTFLIVTYLSVYSFSLSAIFIPHFDEKSYNELKSFPAAKEISFQLNNKKISGWYYYNEGDNNPVILFYYGNGENASTLLNNILSYDKLKYYRGCDIAVFDYPGYGLSEGMTDEKTFKNFALAAFDEVSKFNKNIIIHGYSIGTGAACYAAGKRNTLGLILYAPYADGVDLYNNFLNIFNNPLTESMISFNLKNIKYAETINCPVLICASENDKMVSFASSEKLSNAIKDCKFENAMGISHNQFRTDNHILKITSDFTEDLIKHEQ